MFVYKIPYRRARAWPLGRVRARAKESCIQIGCAFCGDIIVRAISDKEEMFSCKLSQNENRAQHDRFYVFCNVSDLVLHLTFDF